METAQTADRFLKRAAGEFNDLRLAGSQLRYGQHLFMLLSVERSDIAEALRGTPLDPFYDHQVKQRTVDAIRSMW